MEGYKIYGLIDPETKEVRYVGKTVSPLHKRLSSHYNDKSISYKTHWINSLKEKKLKPIIKILEVCNEDNWQEREKYWISHYRAVSRLTNYLDGGQGQQKGYKHTDEAKEKIRLAAIKNLKGRFYKGQRFSDETNKKRADANKKVIYQYDIKHNLIKKWNSIIEAANTLNIDKNNIRAVLVGRSIKAGGFIWTYKENEFIKLINKKHKRILVTDTETNEVVIFKSIKDVSETFKIKREKIDVRLKNNKNLLNLKFEYE
jgi:hypothetical protein